MESARMTLTVTEVAELLGIGRSAAYEACQLGQIPTIRIGRRILIPRAALERLLEHPAAVDEHQQWIVQKGGHSPSRVASAPPPGDPGEDLA